MPITKIDVTTDKYSYLNFLIDNKDLLSAEVDNMPTNREHIVNPFIPKWSLSFMYNVNIGKTKNIRFFPVMEKFIDGLPNNIKMCFAMVSSIGSGDTDFHRESWTKEVGYYRFHLPLSDMTGASIIIDEPNVGCVKYGYEVGNIYRFENAYDSHKPSNFNPNGKTRSIIMMDVIDTNENPYIKSEDITQKYIKAHYEFTNEML